MGRRRMRIRPCSPHSGQVYESDSSTRGARTLPAAAYVLAVEGAYVLMSIPLKTISLVSSHTRKIGKIRSRRRKTKALSSLTD